MAKAGTLWSMRPRTSGRVGVLLGFLAVLVPGATGDARTKAPTGLIAASVENRVVVADPHDGAMLDYPTGPVGFLFPAPGGMLFAPDLVDGRTTVINLRSLNAVAHLDGVTMPHFGHQDDRYLVVAGDVLLVTYPERAPMERVEARIENPWQVVFTRDDAVALILDRRPDGVGGASLVSVDLLAHQLLQRTSLAGDVTRIALSNQLGAIALVDRSSTAIRIVEPATQAVIAAFDVGGAPADAAFVEDGRTLVVAADRGEGGVLQVWQLKTSRNGLKTKLQDEAVLRAPPLRLAVDPTEAFAAVALANGAVPVIELDHGRQYTELVLGLAPRDLVWCDPARPGPVLPEWSDRSPTSPAADLRSRHSE